MPTAIAVNAVDWLGAYAWSISKGEFGDISHSFANYYVTKANGAEYLEAFESFLEDPGDWDYWPEAAK
jgi:hypothetical protein